MLYARILLLGVIWSLNMLPSCEAGKASRQSILPCISGESRLAGSARKVSLHTWKNRGGLKHYWRLCRFEALYLKHRRLGIGSCDDLLGATACSRKMVYSAEW